MLKVLVIDDEEIMRKCISESLSLLDIETFLAEDPACAIAIAKKEEPNVIYIDYYLPEMNGVALMKELKKIVPEALIFFVSAARDEQIITDAVETGAVKFLTKPFSRAQIRDCLTENLKIILKNQRMPQILVVDDEEEVTTYIPRHINRRIKCNITTASDGKDAYEMLKERAFDIVILDLRLPRMHGFDILEALPDLTKRSHVVIISGYEGVENTIKADQLGVKDIFHKPLDLDQLWKHLEQILVANNLFIEKI